VKDCATEDASCDFYVKAIILGNEVHINQDFSVNYKGHWYSRQQVIYIDYYIMSCCIFLRLCLFSVQVESVMRNNKFFGIALIGNTMSFTWLDHSITLSLSSDSNMRIEVCIQTN
jgi:phosphatidylserine synthase